MTPPYPAMFRSGGFGYRLVDSSRDVALYSQTNARGLLVAWEVIRMRWRPERTTGIGLIAAGWRLPRPEDFGRIAWSFQTAGAARRKFEELKVRA